MSGFLRKVCGWGLRRVNHENYCLRATLTHRLREQYRQGQLKTVYDIGANNGQWSLHLQKVLPAAAFYLFEANPAMQHRLEQMPFWFRIVPLSNKAEEKIFFTNNGTGDSFYRQTYGNRSFNEITLQTERLDDVVATTAIPAPDFVKLDTQGSEVDIIDGGRATLAKAKLLLCEMPLVEYNDRAPHFSTYLEICRSIGFYPVAMAEMHRKEGRIVQMDVLFAK
ncbi:MAG: FkbM family methyltransferase [Magnetococcales bacterium]|nr:FkbM family methyltransferase [Magnetococcales bacterium]